jgi:AcrR family transcriptional regulator
MCVALPERLRQNGILMRQNSVSQDPNGAPAPGVAEKLAQRAVAKREAQYADEVRRLLDAGLIVMRSCGTSSSPRVADIVGVAELSNDAFYRHFASKEALVAAILDDGTARLRSYVAHQMAKEATPRNKVRRWVEGVMSQAADEEIAATTRAVMWNGGTVSNGLGSQPSTAAALAVLLHEPFEQLGSSDPVMDASLVAHATIGALSDFLWERVRPTRKQINHLVDFCLNAVGRAQPRKSVKRVNTVRASRA